MANYTFTGNAGQNLGLGISGLSTSPSGGNISVKVLAPDNSTVLVDCGAIYASNGGGSCNIPALPSSGTYSLRITPNSGATANFSATLSSDVTGTLAYGVTKAFTTTRVGQNGRYSFAATAGQDISLLIFGGSFTANNGLVTIIRPDGSTQVSTYFDTSTKVLSMRNLAATGIYTVFVDPAVTSTGSVNLRTIADAGNALTIDGGVLGVSLAQNQGNDYIFTGVAGQRLGLGLSGLTSASSGGGVAVSIIEPDGSAVLTDCGSYAITSGGGSCALTVLPVSGNYIVRLTPSSGISATAQLLLSSYLNSMLTVNADPVSHASMRVGQGGYYRFSAKQGQRYTLKWANTSFMGTIALYQPDGSLYQQNVIDASTNASGSLVVPSASMNGLYSVVITPLGLETGSVQVGITAPVDVSMTTSADEYVYGQPVIVNVVVSGKTPTGTVVISEVASQDSSGNAVLSSATLVSGRQTFRLALPSGSHTLKAEYEGDVRNEGGGFSTATVQVGVTDTSLLSSANPVALTKDVTYQVKIRGASPSGSVSFYDNDSLIGTAVVSGGAASITTNYASVGSHSIVAKYSGDANNLTSTSNTLIETVAVIGVVDTTYEYDAAGRLIHVKSGSSNGQ
ncbi:Ig-like domain repeat protein [Uliginosibacterium gangwonense]|uniref:Ig-like domain-containing protein n=1 Tax=Uliginosibacterium gangwonense TaxID=392736 RepID=UPI003CCB980F